MAQEESHAALAARLRQSVENGGVIAERVRLAAMRLGAGEDVHVADPYVSLARRIAEASFLVTDHEVAEVRDAAGSDRGAFEVIMAASVGAGLRRWGTALRAIEEASDAPG